EDAEQEQKNRSERKLFHDNLLVILAMLMAK
ncbi:MAG: hypothetical protein H6Q96_1240, partial [Nitrospirae bacterium]|nr:hypothetical protein [Nitrospirota bacterium]